MHGPWPDKSGTRDLPSEAKLGSHAAALPAFQPPAQGRECAMVARQLRQDLRQDHSSMAAGNAAQPNHLLPDHGIAQAGRGSVADLRRKGTEPAPW